MKVGAVSRTIITCFKDDFFFLHQDMKMALKLNPSMARAKNYTRSTRLSVLCYLRFILLWFLLFKFKGCVNSMCRFKHYIAYTVQLRLSQIATDALHAEENYTVLPHVDHERADDG